MQLSISLPGLVVERMDALRGDVPRSVWLRRAAEAFDGEGSVELAAGVGASHLVSARASRPLSAGRQHLPTCRCGLCGGGKR